MKILIADDEPLSRRVMHGLLAKWGYEVVSAEDGASAWEQLQSPEAPRIALLDWMMPGLDGVDICRQLRNLRPEPYTYILLISAIDAKDKIVEGLESGADDYLTKPFHPQELKARLRVGMRLLELEDTLIQSREAMRFKATHDVLTDVWNRGAVLEILDREITRSRRECTSLGVLMVDLDHFKSVNDTYGHLTGDCVLREVSRRMSAEIRSYDSIGRYGGEEFLIVLPGCQSADAAHKAEQLRASMTARPVDTPAGPVGVSISVGVVSVANWPSDDLNQILQIADAAMYRAKAGGRNHVVMADATDFETAHRAAVEYSSHGPARD